MLNGLADFIFGSRANEDEQARVTSKENQEKPSGDPQADDEWILINVKDTRNLEDEIKSREASSCSSPVIVANPEIGVMEASTFGNFIGENQMDGVDSDSESLQEGVGNLQLLRVQRVVGNSRRAVSDLLCDSVSGMETRYQQAAEAEARTKDLTQGKMKRASLVFDVKATKKAKQRKCRVKNASGRNNDRKCQ